MNTRFLKTAGFLVLYMSIQACSFQALQTAPVVGSLGGSTGATTTVPIVLQAGQIQLSWNANAGAQSGFYLETSRDGVSFQQSQQVLDPTNTAIISGLISGQKYYFRVRAYNQVGDSPYTAVVSAISN